MLYCLHGADDVEYMLGRIEVSKPTCACENFLDIAVSFALNRGSALEYRRHKGKIFYDDYLFPLGYLCPSNNLTESSKSIPLLRPRKMFSTENVAADSMPGSMRTTEERRFVFDFDARAAQWEIKQRYAVLLAHKFDRFFSSLAHTLNYLFTDDHFLVA